MVEAVGSQCKKPVVRIWFDQYGKPLSAHWKLGARPADANWFVKLAPSGVPTTGPDRTCLGGSIGPLLILNVCKPTNYNDDASFESYLDCLNKLHALLLDTEAIHTLSVGDFNCSPGSKFFPEFVTFPIDNHLSTSDLNHLHDVVTYISDDGC